jgi:hypothetical protein
MDMLLTAVVPFAGIAFMLVTAVMALPGDARVALVAGAANTHRSQQSRDLEIWVLAVDDYAIEDAAHDNASHAA